MNSPFSDDHRDTRKLMFQSPSKRGGRSDALLPDDGDATAYAFQSPSKRGGRSDRRRWRSVTRRAKGFNPLASGEGVQTGKPKTGSLLRVRVSIP